jgi:hypothetical protein
VTFVIVALDDASYRFFNTELLTQTTDNYVFDIVEGIATSVLTVAALWRREHSKRGRADCESLLDIPAPWHPQVYKLELAPNHSVADITSIVVTSREWRRAIFRSLNLQISFEKCFLPILRNQR